MAGDGEAVRLVAHLLDELQRRIGRTRPQFAPIWHHQRFVAGAAFHALGHTYQQHPFHAEVGQRGLGLRQLAGATVDQQYVRQHALLFHGTAEAAVDGLAHGGVVIARLDTADVEAAILRAHRPSSIEPHAGGHGGFAEGMTDVEALDPLDRLGQAQHVAQRVAARVLRVAAVEFGGQGQLRVAAGHCTLRSAEADSAATSRSASGISRSSRISRGGSNSM
ncbi:hypothetical protein G6F50_014490 [Rhizopus delemar]|uniref:Uncharacterized protein n=1 Tax=Rhizopus delemar TaxID=936053 RepID=A0A9P6Y4U9_9FUNG|nr:hypothetical protein G6F50_014490 [Rhizopus delemar]